MPQFVVHQPAIVRIYQAKIPQLGSLIKIWHSRGSQLEKDLRERIELAKEPDPLLDSSKVFQERVWTGVLQQFLDKVRHRFLISGVWLSPGSVNLGLVHGFEHPCLNTFPEAGHSFGRVC